MTLQPKIPKLSKPRRAWKVGDRVRFAHEHPGGPIRTVTALSLTLDNPMVEIEGFSGLFASHLFIAAEGGES